MKEEQVSYIMLFCALMLVKNSKATLEQSVMIVPLVGKAKCLAGELLRFWGIDNGINKRIAQGD